MAFIDKECSVVLHQVYDALVCSGKCPEQRISQASSGGSKVKSEASEKIGPPPVLKVSAISIKEEPDYGIEDVVIKEEPFLYGNEFGEGGSAPATGATDISGASTSKQHTRLGCSQHGLVPAGTDHLQQLVDLEHQASGPHRCSKYTSSSGIGLQQHINCGGQGGPLRQTHKTVTHTVLDEPTSIFMVQWRLILTNQ
ncbi:uncharacterized protein LOC108668233 [Hyalella azteca]|uniref:Uncharacterized protein LOC108668233 n=1 Tax=Hyalella azteca TaxID=294128 RepID=A0A979FIY7_HYAAZ|nr:uncharacterized protein LOC108668233 [Hyalella azteca]